MNIDLAIHLKALLGGYRRSSFSQEGEDLLLERYFEAYMDWAEARFYVEVGAHHPIRFSNTYRFYRSGWRGITIEPNPAMKLAFSILRSRDTHLTCAVDETSGVAKYYQFMDPALNTLDEEVAQERQSSGHRLEVSGQVPVQRLGEILDECGQANISFMSIDVEGKDLSVLKSNDWDRYRPKIIVVESLTEFGKEGALAEFLISKGYVKGSQLFHSSFYHERPG